MNFSLNYILVFTIIVVMMSCGNNQSREQKMLDTTSQVVPIKDVELALFDGITFKGWHAYNKPVENLSNWTIIDSALVCLGAADDAHGGDIVTDVEYGNFELSWEWKVNKGSNSGVMYHVVEDSVYKAPYETGPEYQIIDDVGFPGKLEDWQKAGADYAMYPANNKKKLMPVGEWNSSKIIYNDGHVEHWLNGEKIVEFDRNSEDWKTKRTTGKWKDFPGYATATKGKIALQDHGSKSYFRNIVITEL
ncbi:MAG: DUF1080 domain-containing protein [Bacteroidota bacterium]